MSDPAQPIRRPASHRERRSEVGRGAGQDTIEVIRRGWSRPLALGAVVVTAALIGAAVLAGGGERPGGEQYDGDGATIADSGQAPPPPVLLAAERYVADPSSATLRRLVEAVGGVEALVVADVEGAYDLVRFDPLDDDRLIASRRSSYGQAENQDANELWLVGDGAVSRRLLAPHRPHDFAHFNADGTTTLWVNRHGRDFAPRTAVVVDRDGVVVQTTEPLYASRFAAVGAAVYALTGDGDYYSDADGYQDLVAASPAAEALAPGDGYAWIDNPRPDLLVAYPSGPDQKTSVWGATNGQPLPGHPLAGRSHRRSAVSGDGRTAVGITFDGRLEQIDLATGRVRTTFGSVDPEGIDRPLTLDHSGTLAVTVDRSGRVELWWVGDDTPVATVEATAAQPRWVSAEHGARSASAVAASADRLALRWDARQQTPVTWTIVDIGPDSWITRACELAGRGLTAQERIDHGLDRSTAACV